MALLLDTNVWVSVLRRRNTLLATRLAAAPVSELFFCSVVKAELLYGAMRSIDPAAQMKQLDALFIRYGSIPFDDAAAREYGHIRADLESRGEIIGGNDLMIAAIAVAGGFTLVTHNTAEFRRVTGLRVEDWESP